MAAYQANGAQLGWLLIPEQQAVEVWPAAGAGDPQRLDAATVLDAGLLFPGLRIDLEEIWHFGVAAKALSLLEPSPLHRLTMLVVGNRCCAG